MLWLLALVAPLALVVLSLTRRGSRLAAAAGVAGGGLLFVFGAGAALLVAMARFAFSCSGQPDCARSVHGSWGVALVGVVVAMGGLAAAESSRRRFVALGGPDMRDG